MRRSDLDRGVAPSGCRRDRSPHPLALAEKARAGVGCPIAVIGQRRARERQQGQHRLAEIDACWPDPRLDRRVLNVLSTNSAVTVTRDIAYAPGPRRMLDVYAPQSRIAGRPVVVFFYGGSWDSGSKRDYAFVGQALAQRGYVAVLADYRTYPEVVWPAFLEDNAASPAVETLAASGWDMRPGLTGGGPDDTCDVAPGC